MSYNYRRKFDNMVSGLEKNSRIDITRLELGRPVQPSLIDSFRQRFGELPAGMDDFYSSMDGFELDWTYTGPDHEIHGRGMIDIVPLDRALGDWETSLWSNTNNTTMLYKNLRPIDFFSEEACAALGVSDTGALKDDIIYHVLGESLQDTGYSFSEWIDRAFASRGFFYWIKTLCVDCLSHPEVDAFRRTMPKIFEDYDDRLFQPRCQKLKQPHPTP